MHLSTPTVPLLNEQICFALYNASHALTSHYRELLEPLGVTYPQYLALLVLWETGDTSVGMLGTRLQLDSGTLSPLLRRLEKAGLTARSRPEHDERTVLVSLTPKGSDLRHLAKGIPDLVCAATGLDVASIQSLRDQIAALSQHVRSLA